MAIFVLEDNLTQATHFIQLINEKLNGSKENVYLFSRGKELYDQVYLKAEGNLYFLDICLGNESEGGLIAAKHIRSIDKTGIIVFVSSHTELALQSYKYLIMAFAFIDKNEELSIFSSEIDQCLAAYRELKDSYQEDFIIIKTKTTIFRINPKLISHFESIGMHKVAIYGPSFYQEFYGTLSAIESLHKCFRRVHHSYIVNANNIARIDRKNKLIITTAKDEVPISRKFYKKLINEI